jgi:hypothetical protein
VLTIRHTAWRRHHPTDPNPEDKGKSRRPQSERSGKECLIGGGACPATLCPLEAQGTLSTQPTAGCAGRRDRRGCAGPAQKQRGVEGGCREGCYGWGMALVVARWLRFR